MPRSRTQVGLTDSSTRLPKDDWFRVTSLARYRQRSVSVRHELEKHRLVNHIAFLGDLKDARRLHMYPGVKTNALPAKSSSVCKASRTAGPWLVERLRFKFPDRHVYRVRIASHSVSESEHAACEDIGRPKGVAGRQTYSFSEPLWRSSTFQMLVRAAVLATACIDQGSAEERGHQGHCGQIHKRGESALVGGDLSKRRCAGRCQVDKDAVSTESLSLKASTSIQGQT